MEDEKSFQSSKISFLLNLQFLNFMKSNNYNFYNDKININILEIVFFSRYYTQEEPIKIFKNCS